MTSFIPSHLCTAPCRFQQCLLVVKCVYYHIQDVYVYSNHPDAPLMISLNASLKCTKHIFKQADPPGVVSSSNSLLFVCIQVKVCEWHVDVRQRFPQPRASNGYQTLVRRSARRVPQGKVQTTDFSPPPPSFLKVVEPDYPASPPVGPPHSVAVRLLPENHRDAEGESDRPGSSHQRVGVTGEEVLYILHILCIISAKLIQTV